ncbi:potassium/sodium hyperpolarization-activated cyclic nucleotide-gated channel 2-like isoform X5 [Felis catus]|uniref:potassium/sodium hyperpolarization-activated cyclic nucleotide-gated channel 2-like isoform X5 n=1 Tax=Felis catus TaxID=9685 RepID=UPI001D19BA96|nr:potassium/sodium hyperpolarization-activated cyclic nucleotide-gated channel 2-like isoform X5 [Felis catus]
MGSRSAPGCPGNQARSPVGRAGTGAGPSRPPAATRMLHAPHPPRLVPTPPPPPPLPPRPRPLPAHLQALLLALDRRGRTASQNAPPESGAQLAREPPEGCRYRLKTCPCTSSRQDGSFWTSVKGSPLQESVAGELPPFGVTGPRNNTVIRLAPVTTCLGLPVPAWPPCIQSPCIQSPWRCPCCCSTSWTSWGRRTRSWRATTRSWGTGAPRGSCSTFRPLCVPGQPLWWW